MEKPRTDRVDRADRPGLVKNIPHHLPTETARPTVRTSASMQLNTEALAANRWHLVTRDMDEAINFLLASQRLEAARGHVDEFTLYKAHEAMLKSSIVCYARGFLRSESEGHASPKADIADIPLNTDQIELHKKLIKLRLKAVAHSDWEHHNTKLTDVSAIGVSRTASVPEAWREVDLEQFLEHAHEMYRLASLRSLELDQLAAGLPVLPDVSRALGRGSGHQSKNPPSP